MSPSTSSAIAVTGAAAAAIFLLAWARQLRTRDATSVDVLWTVGVALAATYHAATAEGWPPRRLLLLALVWVWAARLTAHLWRRIARGTEQGEDGRYAALRRSAGARAPAAFLAVYLAQAASVALLGLAFLPIARATESGWRASDALAVAVFALALVGESAADGQLRRWREAPENRGRTCRAGLWRLSRHPNYFFEWLHWTSYALLGVGLAQGELVWLAPLGMFVLIRFVSGVPPAEAQALRSRGEDYRAYQRETSAFFPFPRCVRGGCAT